MFLLTLHSLLEVASDPEQLWSDPPAGGERVGNVAGRQHTLGVECVSAIFIRRIDSEIEDGAVQIVCVQFYFPMICPY